MKYLTGQNWKNAVAPKDLFKILNLKNMSVAFWIMPLTPCITNLFSVTTVYRTVKYEAERSFLQLLSQIIYALQDKKLKHSYNEVQLLKPIQTKTNLESFIKLLIWRVKLKTVVTLYNIRKQLRHFRAQPWARTVIFILK